jgi:ubiquinone/menaquinone biosynthesis C-methylase UbiE
MSMSETLYTSGEYLKKNPTWHVGESSWKAREIRHMMLRNNLMPKTICEAGCGAGEILKLLEKNMDDECTFWGYEISPQAFELCKDRASEKLHFKLSDITKEKDVFFDLLLIVDVLEHMEDYFSFLREIKPKSQYKIIQLPMDISVRSVLRRDLTRYRDSYGHIHYFTKELALQTLKDLGYEVVDYFYTYEKVEELPGASDGLEKNFLIRLRKRLGKMKRSLFKARDTVCFVIHEDLAVRILGRWRLLLLVK